MIGSGQASVPGLQTALFWGRDRERQQDLCVSFYEDGNPIMGFHSHDLI